ncbi:hypothetical protein DNTS_016275, partial [Danionella cerebrum]
DQCLGVCSPAAAAVVDTAVAPQQTPERPAIVHNSIRERCSHPKLFPGDILEFPGNSYFSHFGVYYGERDGVPYVAHLSIRDSDSRLLLFGRAMNSSLKLDPLDMVGKKFKVRNYMDDKHPPRDFYALIKPEIEDTLSKPITFDILFNNSEHLATLLRYGIKKSEQIERVYAKIVPTWKELFGDKKI